MQPVDLVADIMPGNQSRPSKKDLDPPPAQVSRCQHASLILKLSYSLFGVPRSETASTLPFSLTGAGPVVSIYRLNTNNFISIRRRCGLQCDNGSPSIFFYDTLSEKKSDIDQSN